METIIKTKPQHSPALKQQVVDPNTMQAIIVTNYGSPDVLQLQEIDKPAPGENEVQIRVFAASVTAADGMMRKGSPYIGRLYTGLSKPRNSVPGTGFAGMVEAVGNNVTAFKKGDRVFGENIQTFGTNAEYVCVPEDGIIAAIPANMTFEEAAPICDGALTSMNYLKELGQVGPGQKVLINGASGSLGTAAVQIAKYYGAEVTGVCSTENLDMVKSIGADHVIDYTQKDFTQNGKTYDIIYDTVGKSSFPKSKASLRSNGAYISPVLGLSLLLQMMWTSMIGNKKAKFSATGILPVAKLRTMLKEVIKIIETGRLKSVMDQSFPLKNAAQAHAYVDKGHKKGNVVLTIAHK